MARRKKIDYETSMKELESLVAKLEQGDVSLEESLKLYEAGVLITRDCQEALAQAEQKVQILLNQSDLAEFEATDNDS